MGGSAHTPPLTGVLPLHTVYGVRGEGWDDLVLASAPVMSIDLVATNCPVLGRGGCRPPLAGFLGFLSPGGGGGKHRGRGRR